MAVNLFRMSQKIRIGWWFFILWSMLLMGASNGGTTTQTSVNGIASSHHLQRAKVYFAAGDYRRAIQACQDQVDESPSVESYVFLTYAYHATNGYLEWLAQHDEWVKIGQLSLTFVSQETRDLIDPPNALSRMAKELLHEGLRQQFDVTASMANRLDKPTVDRLWQQQASWEKAHPDRWWFGVPEEWNW